LCLSAFDCCKQILMFDDLNLTDLIPFILEEEKVCIKQSLHEQFLSIIFDGTSHSGEAFAILV